MKDARARLTRRSAVLLAAACLAPHGAWCAPIQKSAAGSHSTGHLYVAGLVGGTRYDPATVLRYPLRDGIPAAQPDLRYAGVYGPLAVDATNHLYAVDSMHEQVVVFEPNSTTVARRIDLLIPHSSRYGADYTGMGIDGDGYLALAVNTSNDPYLLPSTPCHFQISLFGPGAHGNAVPTDCLPAASPYSLAFDANASLYVVNSDIGDDALYVFGYAHTAPHVVRVLYGASFVQPLATALGDGEIFVLNLGPSTFRSSDSYVAVYPANANGNVTPLRTIAPPAPRQWEGAIAVSGGRLYVATGLEYVEVYDAAANGRVHALGGVRVKQHGLQAVAVGP